MTFCFIIDVFYSLFILFLQVPISVNDILMGMQFNCMNVRFTFLSICGLLVARLFADIFASGICFALSFNVFIGKATDVIIHVARLVTSSPAVDCYYAVIVFINLRALMLRPLTFYLWQHQFVPQFS